LKARDSVTSKPDLKTTTLSQINLRCHLKASNYKTTPSYIFHKALNLLSFTYPHLLRRKIIPNRYQDGEIEKELVFAYSMKKTFA